MKVRDMHGAKVKIVHSLVKVTFEKDVVFGTQLSNKYTTCHGID
jgi:hypothetical protein